MSDRYHPDWDSVLKPLFRQDYMRQLSAFVQGERAQHAVFPPEDLVFNAFKLTPFGSVKVVILGQDPYHNVGQAHGLSFSVPDGMPLPPSLRNIYTELASDIPGFAFPRSGNLAPWARQGVLLLNATLTVRAHQAASHQGQGWETFTDEIIRQLSERRAALVFILWGSYAQKKSALIDHQKHLVLKAAHPSPLSAHRGFFGCKHFSKTNEYLVSKEKKAIAWSIEAGE